jgi:beta-lactamase regulating signal transducer with metallopeptidase domain
MNELGLTLTWLAVQQAILLAPALALNALASRRGPAAGAQVAVMSLGLVIALNVAALLPTIRWNSNVLTARVTVSTIMAQSNTAPDTALDSPGLDVIKPAVTLGRTFEQFVFAWGRLGRSATEPALRFRPSGSTVAAISLVGSTAGLLQLTLGLWAVALCRRRARRVDDPEMTSLLHELRSTMGCRRPVALREVADLTSPATAGQKRPIVLLPDNWRSWSAAERRAVLAHELAHIVRGDFATSLLARLAVALNYCNPVVRWMAGRLQLQQEQAADALGARFAGGARCYVVALSSLALRQDGRSPRWPVRAFLAARGTLIRRIAMLRDLSNANRIDLPLLGARRMLMVFGLLILTIGAATLRCPVRGADDGAARADTPKAAPRQPTDPSRSFVEPFVRAGTDGVAVVRPAAAFRHHGMDRLLALCQTALDRDVVLVGKRFKVDTSRPGFMKLRCQDIEWITTGVGFDQFPPQVPRNKHRPASKTVDEPLHRIFFGSLAVRMVTPFDWLAFLRQWRLDCEAARAKGRTYYKITGEFKRFLGPNPAVLLLDDRTIAFDDENVISQIASSEDFAPPAYLRSKEWEEASRGLVAFAMTNRNDAFAKLYDRGRPDDAVVLSLFKGLDTWILGVDDADPIALHADATCRDRDSTDAVCRSLDSLIKLGRRSIEQNAPKSHEGGPHELIARMLKALAENVRVEHTDNAITVRAQGFGTLADFALIVDAEA